MMVSICRKRLSPQDMGQMADVPTDWGFWEWVLGGVGSGWIGSTAFLFSRTEKNARAINEQARLLVDMTNKVRTELDDKITEHSLDDQRRFVTKTEFQDLKTALVTRFDRIEGRQDRNLDTILGEIRKISKG